MKDTQILPAQESPSAGLPFHTSLPEHILVVEDDMCIRQLNTEVLTHSGYEVDSAADGAAAWQALNSDSYDLMITDNNMPKVTGVELLQKLHASRMALPVIMATGTLPAVDFTLYPWLQPAATLLKPYTLAEMLRTVKKVLREASDPDGHGDLWLYPKLPDPEISPALAAASGPRPGPAHSAHRILVVDEDRDLRQLYADALAGPGYQVDGVADGAAGWEALQANRYHLLITEHDLPRLTGVELIRKLRAAHMALPVVMAAGRLPTHELARHPSLQLAATLLKPFAIDALLDTVQTALRVTAVSPKPIEPRPAWSSQPSAMGLQF